MHKFPSDWIKWAGGSRRRYAGYNYQSQLGLSTCPNCNYHTTTLQKLAQEIGTFPEAKTQEAGAKVITTYLSGLVKVVYETKNIYSINKHTHIQGTQISGMLWITYKWWPWQKSKWYTMYNRWP